MDMSERLFIVVIDDDSSVCRALRRLLQSAQMEVETHPSGESFLLAVDGRRPDCLVLDMRMPGLTGPELRDRLHDLGHRIPVVFITAHAEELAPERGVGIPEVLRKPFRGELLLAAIGRAVQPPSVN
jgi:FixJ family two-component response regulator